MFRQSNDLRRLVKRQIRRTASLAAALSGLVGASPAVALDSDGDGLSDVDELARIRSVPFGSQRILTNAAEHAFTVAAADLDGDGDIDALSGGSGDRVAWYENRLRESSSDFGPARTVVITSNGGSRIFTADLNRDDAPDVLVQTSASTVHWYRNQLSGWFEDFVIGGRVTETVSHIYEMIAADLDGDGDADVLTASSNDDTVAWSENRLNEATADFGPKRVISATVEFAKSAFPEDLDGDGDPDVLSSSANLLNNLAWHENRLNEASADFGPLQPIAADGWYSAIIVAADLDGDGDSDILMATPGNGNTIRWAENRLREASADFGPVQIITTAVQDARRAIATDLDGDGDLDVVSASSGDDKLAWYENRLNEPSPGFGSQQIISRAADAPREIVAADFDGDGDPDLLAASQFDDEVAWYANPGTNPLDSDTDDDGLSDGDEVISHSTDPNDPDMDDDGLADGEEVLSHLTNPFDPDMDDDGLTDGEEIEQHGTDPTNADSDEDGLRDDFEVVYGFDPLTPGEGGHDTDSDGLDNITEQAIGTAPTDSDSDDDGLTDGEEVNVYSTSPLDPDADDDGLSDGQEVNVHATDPRDSDSDDDGSKDRTEITYGSDPNDRFSYPHRIERFEASLVLHSRGNDTTTGSGFPFDRQFFIARPLGARCNANHGGADCGSATLQRGAPLHGYGYLGPKLPPYPGIGIYRSNIGVNATGSLPVSSPYQFVSTFASGLRNGPGSFVVGGGPGSYRFTAPSVSFDRGGVAIRAGPRRFGGTMRLLGKLGSVRSRSIGNDIFVGKGDTHFGALGEVCRNSYYYDYPYYYAYSCTGLVGTQATGTLRLYETAMGETATVSIMSWGFGWTTGTVSVLAGDSEFPTAIRRKGYDNRTPTKGRGAIQLVAPRLVQWKYTNAPGKEVRTTGSIAIFRLVPEPKAWVALAAGWAFLLGIRHLRK